MRRLRQNAIASQQIYSIDPRIPLSLSSIELMAEKVAPALGWGDEACSVRRAA
jgi:hypothetical protein